MLLLRDLMHGRICAARMATVAAVRGFASNLWFKLRRGESCCGNYGDPGC